MKTFILCAILALVATWAPTPVSAQEFSEPSSWSFGTEAGVQARTAAGTAFIIAGHGDYRFRPSISAGALAWASSATGLTEYAGALVGSYHFEVGKIQVAPFAGMGFLRAHYENEKTGVFYVPVGVRGEYRVGGSTFTGSLMINFHQLYFDTNPKWDRGSVAFMLGFKI